MAEANSGQTNPVYQMANFVKEHQLSIGLLLTFFGVADLWFVMPNMYAVLLDWHVSGPVFSFYMPEWVFTIPILLIISLIGTLMLCVYSIRDIRPESVDNKEHAAILVTALGFTYQVIGAWPLWNQPYSWPWQAEIATYGNLLVFPLFIGSLLALIIGASSLYIHSKIYREKHPEILS
ncbi:MAG: hypothetical protein ABSC20_04340 [Candidatus Bathyarchaeia archaeon]|jgi:hypothetical protein